MTPYAYAVLGICILLLAVQAWQLAHRVRRLHQRVQDLEGWKMREAERIDAMFDQLVDYETDAGGFVREVKR